ncbi:hypothetical protein SELMODRAFT_402001 [Selaginella moellendorffii]|uniref:Uncharacterized protein n=1 Tax=Selaginella moellendorffii TaxID=88036 RepID=D8QP97_SELML|nr:hypothetical protein SELMODRAFT_402001 [Selaginella moellendorffii]
MVGVMLWHRFPNLHTYRYGVLPCVDTVIAEAGSRFLSSYPESPPPFSVVYNDKFALRMSMASLMRLRVALLRALAADSDTSKLAVIARVARRLFSSWRTGKSSNKGATNEDYNQSCGEAMQDKHGNCGHKLKGGAFLCYHACDKDAHGSSTVVMGRLVDSTANGAVNGNSGSRDKNSRAMSKVTNFSLVDFRDLVVSPSMFLDHMPWRLQCGLNDVLKQVCTQPLHADAESQGSQVNGF